MTTYRIDTPVGCSARWLPSVDAAKDAYRRMLAESVYGDAPDPLPEITFVETTEPLEDEQPAWKIECRLDGNLDCVIWPERPEWPSNDYGSHGKSPDLVMVSDNYMTYCRHPKLVCSLDEPTDTHHRQPRIECASCGAQWTPETGHAHLP